MPRDSVPLCDGVPLGHPHRHRVAATATEAVSVVMDSHRLAPIHSCAWYSSNVAQYNDLSIQRCPYMTYKYACIAKGTASKTDLWIGIILSVAACVTSSLCWTRQSIVLAWIIHYKWYGWRTSRGAEYITTSSRTVCHMCLKRRTHPLPVVQFPPQLVAFPQSVGGLSVCAQADTGTHRATDAKTNRCAAVATSSSLKWLLRLTAHNPSSPWKVRNLDWYTKDGLGIWAGVRQLSYVAIPSLPVKQVSGIRYHKGAGLYKTAP